MLNNLSLPKEYFEVYEKPSQMPTNVPEDPVGEIYELRREVQRLKGDLQKMWLEKRELEDELERRADC